MWRPVAAGTLLAMLSAGAAAFDRVQLGSLTAASHVHGLGVAQSNPPRVFIATHLGLYQAGPGSTAELISAAQDFIAFDPAPNQPERLYASGHDTEIGQFGFVISGDRGRTWSPAVTEGNGQTGPSASGSRVDFHQFAVSGADFSVMYGAASGIWVSRDGGASWQQTGETPTGLHALAASVEDAETLFAATRAGLLVSRNAGATWRLAIADDVVSVETFSGGAYAFSPSRGLLRITGNEDAVTVLSGRTQPMLVQLAADPAVPGRLFAATAGGRILISSNEGRAWRVFAR